MQHKTRVYAKVLFDFLQKGKKEEFAQRIKRFKDLLKRRGDLKFASGVLQEFSKLWKERKGKIATVISAKLFSNTFKESFVKKLKKHGFVFEHMIDEKVIGGVAIFLGNEYMIDSTIQGRLTTLK